MVNIKNYHPRTLNSLAPPTRQSLKSIQLYNSGVVGPTLINEVPLESLDQDEFNYDVNFHLIRFSAILNVIKKHFRSRRLSDFNGTWHIESSDQASQKLACGSF